MIFVTVGHQMPFDRLVAAVDRWAAETGAGRDEVFAQIGTGGAAPRHIEHAARLGPDEFRRRLTDADAIVAHAGMGTILSAIELGRPLLVLPRRAHLGETRTDHQVATARHFADAGYVLAADTEDEIATRMDELRTFRPRSTIGAAAEPRLIERLRKFAA